MKKLIEKPWIDKILDVSTIHITKRDSELLEADASTGSSHALLVREYEEGFFVYVDKHGGEKCREDFSPEFKAIIAEARRRKCKWVCFDCDAMEYDELPKFEW